MKINIDKLPEPFLRSIDVHELLPQKEPFVMIDHLILFDMTRTISETFITKENLFVEDGMFSACGLIENIAQTCAARIGLINKYISNKDIQIGFIGAIRNLEVISLPKIGETIITIVDVLEEVFGVILARAVISCNGENIVTAEIKIAVKE